MDIDNISQKVKTVASNVIDETGKMTKSVVKKSESFIEQSKLKFAQNDIEKKMNDVYAAIGKYVYEQHREGVEFTDVVGENCSVLDELNDELKEIKVQIADVKNSVICSECENLNSAENLYCAKCGAKL